MRYLFGDSVPFPPQYDFLAALDVFCTHAARAVRLDAESRGLRKTADDAAAVRTREVRELDAFHKEAVGALRDASQDATARLVAPYVKQLTDVAQQIVVDVHRSATDVSDREHKQALAAIEARSVDVRDALEKMLVAVRLPVTDSQITMGVIDGRNEFSAVFSYRGGLVAAFTIGGSDVDAWRQPKHVRDFAENVTLPVGVKRSLFKRTIAAETIALDEYVIGGFELRDDQAELRLRRKVELPDSLVFSVRRLEDRLSAEVHHPDDTEADLGLAPVLDQASATEVERLWQLLKKACTPALANKRRLVSLQLGGVDVVSNDLSTKVVALIVDSIAGTVVEISRRSSNSHELSLKVESDEGRREEIYLKKQQLEATLASVPQAERGIFEPLDLLPPHMRAVPSAAGAAQDTGEVVKM